MLSRESQIDLPVGDTYSSFVQSFCFLPYSVTFDLELYCWLPRGLYAHTVVTVEACAASLERLAGTLMISLDRQLLGCQLPARLSTEFVDLGAFAFSVSSVCSNGIHVI